MVRTTPLDYRKDQVSVPEVFSKTFSWSLVADGTERSTTVIVSDSVLLTQD